MNERIRELAKQAITDKLTLDEFINDLKLNPNRYWGFTDSELEKFAELIIKKCISQIALIGVSNFQNEDISWTVDTAIAKIEEHFGVEE